MAGSAPNPLDRAKRCDLKVITGTDPGAGAEVSVTVPAGMAWDVLSMRVDLVSSAVAGSREPSLVLDDGTTEFARVPATIVVSASSTRRFTWTRVGGLQLSGALPTSFAMPIPELPLLSGYRVRTVTIALDAGDNYGVPILYVAEYTF